jgi:hypothetical protein
VGEHDHRQCANQTNISSKTGYDEDETYIFRTILYNDHNKTVHKDQLGTAATCMYVYKSVRGGGRERFLHPGLKTRPWSELGGMGEADEEPEMDGLDVTEEIVPARRGVGTLGALPARPPARHLPAHHQRLHQS